MTRQFSPSAERNRQPLLDALLPRLEGRVLEVASGTGQHARWFTDAHPGVTWQPTESDPERLESIEGWRDGASERMLAPAMLDVLDTPWGYAEVDRIVAINLVHISPWNVSEGLFAGAARTLSASGELYLYGPFMVDGRHTAPSNAEFDVWLKNRSPAFGVRDMADLEASANRCGLVMQDPVAMPANNFVLAFSRR